MEIDLSRITIRPFRLEDVDDFMLWASDDEVTRNLRWKTIHSKEEALTFIKDICIPHPWRRSICLEDHSIGFVSIYPGTGETRCRAEMGYALATRYWGRGITTKAVKLALSQVFKDLPDVIRLQSYVDIGNKGSQRVLEKAGFQREGVLRKYEYIKGNLKDLVLFSFLSMDVPANEQSL